MKEKIILLFERITRYKYDHFNKYLDTRNYLSESLGVLHSSGSIFVISVYGRNGDQYDGRSQEFGETGGRCGLGSHGFHPDEVI